MTGELTNPILIDNVWERENNHPEPFEKPRSLVCAAELVDETRSNFIISVAAGNETNFMPITLAAVPFLFISFTEKHLITEHLIKQLSSLQI